MLLFVIDSAENKDVRYGCIKELQMAVMGGVGKASSR